jgi:menaquinone-dependent protoporphyrinogen oxidase
MKSVLVLYATRDGQTRRIAEHICAALGSQQLESDLRNVADVRQEFSLTPYSAAILCATVRLGKHEKEMTRFVKRHVAELQQMATAFVSVSLSAAGAEDIFRPPEMRAKARVDVKRVIDAFLAETGWHPSQTKAVAGALLYTRYNFILRRVMRRIARQTGALTDMSQDYEFTDWAGLDRLVDEFVLTSGLVPQHADLWQNSLSR